MKNKSPAYLKALNQKEICLCIMEHGPMTRANLATRLSLSKPTTSLNVQGLIDKKILTETVTAFSTVGKKGTLLDFNPLYHHILIVDTSTNSIQNEIVFHVCNLKEEVIKQDTVSLPSNFITMPFTKQATIIKQEVLTFLNLFQQEILPISHIVFSIPGIINNNDPKYLAFSNSIQEELSITCSVYNDLNLALLGENYCQNKVTTKNLCYIRINQGVGAAFILNNKLYTGHQFSAGEIGYYEILIEKEDTITSMPLHKLISIHTILEKKNEKNIVFDSTTNDFNDLLLGIQKQDPWCLKTIHKTYYYLENLVMNLCATLDLDEIIIAGAIHQLIPTLTQKLQQKINQYPLTKTVIRTPIQPYGSIYGGYTLGLQAIMEHII